MVPISSTVQTLSSLNSLKVLEFSVIVEQVVLPCECLLMWNSMETRIVLCQLHSREYLDWDGNDHEFIQTLTSEHSYQMKRLDSSELAKLR